MYVDIIKTQTFLNIFAFLDTGCKLVVLNADSILKICRVVDDQTLYGKQYERNFGEL